MEFDILPVLGSQCRPEALHLGSSGKRFRNLSSCFLNFNTVIFVMLLILGGRQFHRLLAVNANEELRGISAGL